MRSILMNKTNALKAIVYIFIPLSALVFIGGCWWVSCAMTEYHIEFHLVCGLATAVLGLCGIVRSFDLISEIRSVEDARSKNT